MRRLRKPWMVLAKKGRNTASVVVPKASRVVEEVTRDVVAGASPPLSSAEEQERVDLGNPH